VNPERIPSTEPAAAALPGLLVDPAWLRQQLGTPRLRVVDLREPDAYRSGHIPGAANLELAGLGAKVGGLDNVLLPEREFAQLMARCGISNGDMVVAYDDQWGLAAARLVWALHYYGHAEVAVLDGGWDRWAAVGGAIAEGVEPIAPGRFEAHPRADRYADRAWVAARAEAGDAVLLDTRTPAEFDRGHLPGARCWDWFNAVPVDGWSVSRDPEELRSEWHALGLRAADEVIVYCRSGMRAAHTYLVLKNAGFENVRLYDGSWQEWSMTMEGTGGD
jgi:thiosulfate/3-mercaptopyruvate sulfurtransferase